MLGRTPSAEPRPRAAPPTSVAVAPATAGRVARAALRQMLRSPVAPSSPSIPAPLTLWFAECRWHALLALLVVARDHPLVGLHHERRRDEVIGRCAIARHRHVVDDADAHQRLDVHVMRLRLERIPEEDQDVEPPLRDHRPELQIPTQRPRLEALDWQAELLAQQAAGRARGEKLVLLEKRLVVASPLDDLLLLVIVRHQRDTPTFSKSGHARTPDTRSRHEPRAAARAEHEPNLSAARQPPVAIR